MPGGSPSRDGLSGRALAAVVVVVLIGLALGLAFPEVNAAFKVVGWLLIGVGVVGIVVVVVRDLRR